MGWCTCGPDEALIVTGVGIVGGVKMLIGGGSIWVHSCFQKIKRLNLNVMTLEIKSDRVYTNTGVAISVVGVAQVKVGPVSSGSGNDNLQDTKKRMISKACELFLGKSERDIARVAYVNMECYQRAIMGTLSVEEILADRKKFAAEVFKVATTDLIKMGISVVSYQLKLITDDMDYLASLGKARQAQVNTDARIGEAIARMDTTIKSEKSRFLMMNKKYENDVFVAQSERDYMLKQAMYDQEVAVKKAESDLAYELQQVITKQAIKEEEMEIKVVERIQAIKVADQEIECKRQFSASTIRRPADAEKYRLEALAVADRKRVVLQAEAEAESIRMKGEAQAFAIEEKAKAEAALMTRKAAAWNEYTDAARVEMILSALPAIANNVAEPLTHADKVIMVSSGKGPVGASKLTGEIVEVIEKIPHLIKSMTGVDISQSF